MITDRCSTLGLLFVLYGEYGSESNNGEYQIYRMVSLYQKYFLNCNNTNYRFHHQLIDLLIQLFMMLAILDISSHWCQMYVASSLKLHHKSAEGNANRFFLVRYYYESYPFFGYCCVSAELTYITMYVLLHATQAKDGTMFVSLITYLLYVCIPGCTTKQIVNVFQLLSSCNAVAVNDAHTKSKNE